MGKLAWKVEFAARWAAYDIRFEAYGKDIMDSVHVNDWVAENILGYAPPHHVKYEMFLDRRGKKISKSLGNVITSQRWLKMEQNSHCCYSCTSGLLERVSWDLRIFHL